MGNWEPDAELGSGVPCLHSGRPLYQIQQAQKQGWDHWVDGVNWDRMLGGATVQLRS